MDEFHSIIIDNIKKEPELIIEDIEEDFKVTEEHEELCDQEDIKKLIDDRVLCTFCNKTFGNLQILQAHKKFYHSDVVYNCHLCKFKTKYYSNLQKHNDSIHLNVFNYQCPICGKKFKDQSNKNRHVRTIHKNSTYHCDICNQKFSRRDNVNLHMKRVHGITNMIAENSLLKCDQCDLKYTTKINLLKHMRKVHLQSDKKI